ncbi:Na+/H+ antiporter subunit E [Spirilliplanes yamanashiensis]|uniref:Na+/H+ antiporter subunit E n=1 Tax=Spirilliplanes yamanashiensis TaxID=42233 RepID=A0A8J3YCM8_9ACTN|nr:Na+/H+ antiporter subunit E [Spirilliplanes yamanashiensis]MDP9818999.1 multicomponent Na+:H+ antiporter subunit E [Spirilliplanes yamanashiensis]GIJ05454.1 Na+/H+ antiporter subunit E [Spirilliplanes yamanashiensis]
MTPRLRRRNRIVAVAGLVAVWLLLWGSFTPLTLAGGIVLALVVLAVFPLPPVTFAGRLRPWPIAVFTALFLRDLLLASAQIAWLAIRPGPPPRSAIIAVPLRVGSDLNLTLTAEAVSLIPGSLIVEADRRTGTLYVHVLGVTGPAGVERARAGVLDLEARIVRAIGSAAELAALDPEGAPR